jgi:cytochrome c biogenesis protein CcmG/thiol:disulfide interchange protein DsbE
MNAQRNRIGMPALATSVALGLSLLPSMTTDLMARAPQAPDTSADKPSTSTPSQRLEVQPADLKWLDRVPKDDRAALDELLGWAPPAFTKDLEWVGPAGEASQPLTWDSLRGRVVVIQSFTTATTAGRGWPQRIGNALKEHDAKDLRIIALHTPEGAAEAKELLGKKPAPESVAVAIDPTGAFCDALAIYKHPINIAIDRNGAVRYAGLNLNGLEEAVKILVAEPFQQNLVAPSRDGGSASADGSSASNGGADDFPPFTGKVDHALDIRGKKAPEFFVSEWLTDKPDASGKVVVLDFWATWCPPCVASIPHMNELATKFADEVVCVGISDETRSNFEKGMERLQKQKNLTLNSFKYSLALEPGKKMKGAIQIAGIPHCIVMDRNWIVRWQGHPAALDAATLQRIVKADKAQAGAGGGESAAGKSKAAGSKRKSWMQ